jgi:SET domain-containing protein
MLRVGKSEIGGRGVFAQRPIRKGEVLERAPVVVVPGPEWEDTAKTLLCCYTFRWGEDDFAIALGYGGLYNHSYQPNAAYEKCLAEQVVEFVAIADIAEGEEITINYNGEPDDDTPIWFDGPYWGWHVER